MRKFLTLTAALCALVALTAVGFASAAGEGPVTVQVGKLKFTADGHFSPKALARRDAALRQCSGFLESGRAETAIELPGITALSLAGGINELLYSEILHGASAQLPDRLPDLMFWVTLPFLGATGASTERERVRQSMRDLHRSPVRDT